MRKHSASLRSLALFALLALGLGACQAIAGIEDRTLDPNATSTHADSKQCKDYCAVVMSNCSGDNSVYTTEELCLGVCAELEPGDPNEPSGNTVACRVQQADFAAREPADHCKAAGPGGNDVCGSDCDAYCALYPKVCRTNYEYLSTADCLKACSGLTKQDSFNVVTDHGGDTIECRLVHVSSATVKPDEHCPHALIPPTQPWCAGKPDASPTCTEYCNIELSACDAGLTQYESPEQCLAVCAALEPGRNDDQTGNTVGCRRYHAFSATLAPNTHCYHSGPSGDGHCGDHVKGNCDSYCTLLAASCPVEFAAEMVSADKCLTACEKLPEAATDSKYTLDSAKRSKGLQCRILHAVRAFEDKTACASAIGGDQCQ
jgi:hypothetical protein